MVHVIGRQLRNFHSPTPLEVKNGFFPSYDMSEYNLAENFPI